MQSDPTHFRDLFFIARLHRGNAPHYTKTNYFTKTSIHIEQSL